MSYAIPTLKPAPASEMEEKAWQPARAGLPATSSAASQSLLNVPVPAPPGYKKLIPQEAARIHAQDVGWMRLLARVSQGEHAGILGEGSEHYTKDLAKSEHEEFQKKHATWEEVGKKAGFSGDAAKMHGAEKWVEEGADDAYKQARTARKNKLYLGRVADTATLKPKDKTGGRILNTARWSPSANAAFMEGGIGGGATFKLATQLPDLTGLLTKKGTTGADLLKHGATTKHPHLWDSKENRHTALGGELAQLLDAGYTFHEKPKKNVANENRLVARPAPRGTG